MEFRCRLASPNGEIVEGVYVAEDEAHLRHEMEEKGLFILSLQPKNAIAGVAIRLPQRRGVNMREFLVFNQELATLLKAGMPLVQSLDILRSRVLHPTFRSVLDAVYERVRAGSALSDAFAEHGNLFPGANRWLAISVRPAGVGSYTLLTPREPLTPAPYAIGLELPFSGAANLAGGAFSVVNNGLAVSGTSQIGAGVAGTNTNSSSVSSAGVVGTSTASNGNGVSGFAPTISFFRGFLFLFPSPPTIRLLHQIECGKLCTREPIRRGDAWTFARRTGTDPCRGSSHQMGGLPKRRRHTCRSGGLAAHPCGDYGRCDHRRGMGAASA